MGLDEAFGRWVKLMKIPWGLEHPSWISFTMRKAIARVENFSLLKIKDTKRIKNDMSKKWCRENSRTKREISSKFSHSSASAAELLIKIHADNAKEDRWFVRIVMLVEVFHCNTQKSHLITSSWGWSEAEASRVRVQRLSGKFPRSTMMAKPMHHCGNIAQRRTWMKCVAAEPASATRELCVL